MIDIREPKYQWGQRVAAVADIFNDGSYPDQGDDALLVAAGTEGEIVRIGHIEDSNMPLYLVEFAAANGAVVGCLEEELQLMN